MSLIERCSKGRKGEHARDFRDDVKGVEGYFEVVEQFKVSTDASETIEMGLVHPHS